jgi:hypothetical protein
MDDLLVCLEWCLEYNPVLRFDWNQLETQLCKNSCIETKKHGNRNNKVCFMVCTIAVPDRMSTMLWGNKLHDVSLSGYWLLLDKRDDGGFLFVLIASTKAKPNLQFMVNDFAKTIRESFCSPQILVLHLHEGTKEVWQAPKTVTKTSLPLKCDKSFLKSIENLKESETDVVGHFVCAVMSLVDDPRAALFYSSASVDCNSVETDDFFKTVLARVMKETLSSSSVPAPKYIRLKAKEAELSLGAGFYEFAMSGLNFIRRSLLPSADAVLQSQLVGIAANSGCVEIIFAVLSVHLAVLIELLVKINIIPEGFSGLEFALVEQEYFWEVAKERGMWLAQ